MSIHVLVFFLCASLGTAHSEGIVDLIKPIILNRHELEVAALLGAPHMHHMHDVYGKLIPITTDRGPPIDLNGEVTFKLYTKQKPSEGRELKINDATSLTNSGFHSSKPTYMIAHGWQSNENGSCGLIRDAYLANIDANVIVIDWSSHSMSYNYIDVTYVIKSIGERVKLFIKWLYANGLKADDLILVGHSLGAHVMGLAGYGLTPQVSHIVGLDPALPMFNYATVTDALSRMGAKHVQIIHTNAGYLGYACPHGHSDFYLNDGTNQPGCCDLYPFVCSACSHSRAVALFAESITMDFNGTECLNYNLFKTNNCAKDARIQRMGGLIPESGISGSLYVRTNHRAPFSKVSEAGDIQYAKLLDILPTPVAGCGWLYGSET